MFGDGDCAALADRLVAIVLAAGRTQMRYFRSGVAVVSKADASPVTIADQESEAAILAALAAIAPGVAVVAEEASAAGRIPAPAERFFLVDPLDGTKEFIAGRPEFTINIALIAARRPVFGIIYAPATGQFYATLGAGHAIAATIAPGAAARGIADLGTRRIHTRKPDRARLVACLSRSHMNPATERFLAPFAIAERHAAGSSLKFCVIAEGKADINPRLGPTCEWDTAAGHAILAAAGGSVTLLDGKPLNYGKADAGYRNPDYVAWGDAAFVP